jgi:hypothetical protein
MIALRSPNPLANRTGLPARKSPRKLDAHSRRPSPRATKTFLSASPGFAHLVHTTKQLARCNVRCRKPLVENTLFTHAGIGMVRIWPAFPFSASFGKNRQPEAYPSASSDKEDEANRDQNYSSHP